MLKKTVEIAILYDIYNQLLTEKQRDITDLYYNHDLSLGEIADKFNVSRQAVYDMLKRTERLLYQYEKKLNFVSSMDAKNKKILDILDNVIDLENKLNSISSPKQLLKQVVHIKCELYKFLDS